MSLDIFAACYRPCPEKLARPGMAVQPIRSAHCRYSLAGRLPRHNTAYPHQLSKRLLDGENKRAQESVWRLSVFTRKSATDGLIWPVRKPFLLNRRPLSAVRQNP